MANISDLPSKRTTIQYGILQPGGCYSFHFMDAASAFSELGPDGGTVIRRTTIETVEVVEPEAMLC